MLRLGGGRSDPHGVDVLVTGHPTAGGQRALELVHAHRQGGLEGLGVVDGSLSSPLGVGIGLGVSRPGRVRVVDRPAHRAVVADREGAGELARHPGDPALAEVEKPLAEVEHPGHCGAVVDRGQRVVGAEPGKVAEGGDDGP